MILVLILPMTGLKILCSKIYLAASGFSHLFSTKNTVCCFDLVQCTCVKVFSLQTLVRVVWLNLYPHFLKWFGTWVTADHGSGSALAMSGITHGDWIPAESKGTWHFCWLTSLRFGYVCMYLFLHHPGSNRKHSGNSSGLDELSERSSPSSGISRRLLWIVGYEPLDSIASVPLYDA